MEIFAFDPASNLLDEKNQQVQRPLDHDPKRNTLMDNLLREYAGSHYDYDERGNQIRRWHNGQHSRLHWDLFDRLVRFENSQLRVDYAYDPLGRRLYKHSNAHHLNRSEAGSQWNRNELARKQRELGCGFTLFGWDGDTLAWESSPAQADGASGKTVHYLYEPGTFVPVAQALRHQPMRLLAQPSHTGAYDIDQDPLWTHTPQALPIDVLAWYQCDHLGTPQELTDPTGQIAWSAQYSAWGEVKEQRSEWAQHQGLINPIRFQGQYHDHETGLHYNRHRYYDPQVGRFISKDPISYAGGLNLYAYAPNPTGWIDPLGLAKRGPKTNGEGPHNQVIQAWGQEVEASGGRVIAGGGVKKEQLVLTPGGNKGGRRPDIIYEDVEGKIIYGNVGKNRADQTTPIVREKQALDDLRTKIKGEFAPDDVQFRPYNCTCQRK